MKLTDQIVNKFNVKTGKICNFVTVVIITVVTK